MEKSLLDLGREIQAIAKTGLEFCPNPYDIERFQKISGLANEILARHSDLSKERLEGIYLDEKGYTTPKIDVRAVVFHEGKVLMVKEAESGAWSCPGGYVDVNESLREAVERETFEESGWKVRAWKVAGIFDHRKGLYKRHLYHFHKTYVLCDLVGGEAKASFETSAVAFFSRSEIENLSLDPGRIAKPHLVRMFDHLADPSLPTDFD